MTRSGSVAERVRSLIRARAGGGPRPMAELADVVVTHGEGSHLITSSGDRLLDTVAGYGVASLGHSHPQWVDAVVSQARRTAVTSLYTEELGEYLDRLGRLLPEALGGIALSSTGAEAVEMAVRLAQTATGRSGVLRFDSGFHGKTAALRYPSRSASEEAVALSPRWLHNAPLPLCEVHDAVDYATCDEPVDRALEGLASRDDLDSIGAVLIEPVLGTAGNLPPKRPFLPALRALCDERGWLLIFDESITGFGRTGDLFAYRTFDTRPDVLVLSKGLGGGFPLSAVCASHELWNRSALASPSATSSSFGGNPLACAAGMAALDVIANRAFLDHVQQVAAGAAQRLRELADASHAVTRPRGVGLLLGFDLVDPDSGDLASADACAEAFRACRDRGVLVAVGSPRVRINPPLTVNETEIDFLFDVLHDVLA